MPELVSFFPQKKTKKKNLELVYLCNRKMKRMLSLFLFYPLFFMSVGQVASSTNSDWKSQASRGCLTVKFPRSCLHLYHTISIRVVIVIIEYCYYPLLDYQIIEFLGLF
jgi:dipeptide/tripeptide permease